MKLYRFYVWDDPELYHQEAANMIQARKEICENFEIEPDQIETIEEVLE